MLGEWIIPLNLLTDPKWQRGVGQSALALATDRWRRSPALRVSVLGPPGKIADPQQLSLLGCTMSAAFGEGTVS